jgi:hypothetical protein
MRRVVIREVLVIRERFLVPLVVEIGVRDFQLGLFFELAVGVVIDDRLEGFDGGVIVDEGEEAEDAAAFQGLEAVGVEVVGRFDLLERRRAGLAPAERQAQDERAGERVHAGVGIGAGGAGAGLPMSSLGARLGRFGFGLDRLCEMAQCLEFPAARYRAHPVPSIYGFWMPARPGLSPWTLGDGGKFRVGLLACAAPTCRLSGQTGVFKTWTKNLSNGCALIVASRDAADGSKRVSTRAM